MGALKFGLIQQGIVFVCVKNLKPASSMFLKQNQKPDSLLLHISNYWKNDQVSRSRLFRWEFPLHDWILCVSPFQSRNPPRIVDTNATLLSSCDLQHLLLCVPHQHLLFLIWFAFGVECFYFDVKRKVLETLDSKVYTWGWHQVLGAVLLSKMVIQINLGFCGEIGILGKIQCTSRTTHHVTRMIGLCSLGTTILTCNFLVSI